MRDGVQVPDGSIEDIDDTDPYACRDTNGDVCDDRTDTGVNGTDGDPANDGDYANGISDAGEIVDPISNPNPNPEGTSDRKSSACGAGASSMPLTSCLAWA